MGKWEDMYQAKLTTPEEVAKTFQDGDKIFCGSGSCTPDAFLNALFDRAEELRNVVFGGLIILGPTYKILGSPEMARHIQFDNMYATPLDRQALADGICVHTPIHFSELPRLAGEFGGYNKVVTQCSPMDKNGYFSGSVSGNFLDTLDWVNDIVLEVNEHQPRLHGRNFYHISQVRAII
jgi:4-hydroxybutyrate CoA-transferase